MLTYLIIIVLCIIMSAYFSATETAFSSFNRIRIKNLAEKGNKKAALVLKLDDSYDTLISSILIGNNIVNILSASLSTLLFTDIITKIGTGKLDASSIPSIASTVSTVVMTLIVLTFGEISPKTIAKKNPERFALFSAPIMYWFVKIFFLPAMVFKFIQNLLGKIFKSSEDQGMTEEELISIVEEAAEDGNIDEEESTLIKSAIEFNELEVGDIYTPRIDITAVRTDITKMELAQVFSESGYSRIPIYENDLDNIIGIVYYKDFFTNSFKAATPISEIIKPVMYVTKTQKINDLLKDLQEKQLHLAVVSDEYGSTAGIVTLEDILEEIVGEIWDEHDEIIEEIKAVSENEYIVSGMANLEKLFEELDIDINEELDAMTVNGWAMSILDKIPEEGDTFEELGLTVTVLKMDGRRIENLQIIDNREKESEDDADDKDND